MRYFNVLGDASTRANMLKRMQESAPDVTRGVTHYDGADGDANNINELDDEIT